MTQMQNILIYGAWVAGLTLWAAGTTGAVPASDLNAAARAEMQAKLDKWNATADNGTPVDALAAAHEAVLPDAIIHYFDGTQETEAQVEARMTLKYPMARKGRTITGDTEPILSLSVNGSAADTRTFETRSGTFEDKRGRYGEVGVVHSYLWTSANHYLWRKGASGWQIAEEDGTEDRSRVDGKGPLLHGRPWMRHVMVDTPKGPQEYTLNLPQGAPKPVPAKPDKD